MSLMSLMSLMRISARSVSKVIGRSLTASRLNPYYGRYPPLARNQSSSIGLASRG
jgi:hypothetical protein